MVRDEVARGYDELAREAESTEPPVAVRSSALGEDSQDATFAGQQETYLWVREVEHEARTRQRGIRWFGVDALVCHGSSRVGCFSALQYRRPVVYK